METTRWTNPSQPQTLQSSVILLYVSAGFSMLFGGLGSGLLVLLAAAKVAAGWGCANERKWGYQLAVGAALAPFAILIYVIGLDGVAHHLLRIIVSFAFDIVLVALLVHRETRSYQRIWFR
jgi:hypothetical protein